MRVREASETTDPFSGGSDLLTSHNAAFTEPQKSELFSNSQLYSYLKLRKKLNSLTFPQITNQNLKKIVCMLTKYPNFSKFSSVTESRMKSTTGESQQQFNSPEEAFRVLLPNLDRFNSLQHGSVPYALLQRFLGIII